MIFKVKMIELCKQGIEFKDGYVLKKHDSLENALLEKNVALLYSQNHIKKIYIPKYKGIIHTSQGIYLKIEKIGALSLMGKGDKNINQQLVYDLALFHGLFSQKGNNLSSSVLYRDAIKSNYLLDKDKLVHIDFSSSNRWVHCFDDLALLLHPLWSDIKHKEMDKLVSFYIDSRQYFHNQNIINLNDLDNLNIKNSLEDERRDSYKELIVQMKDSSLDSSRVEDELNDVDFNNILLENFNTFFKFRTLRGKYYLNKVWDKR
jgi:hypothetical protein